MSYFSSIVEQNAVAYSGYVFYGEGTETRPFLINGICDLTLLYNKVRAADQTYNSDDVWYKLTVDINLPASYSSPLGTLSNPFLGNFDGDGHTISNVRFSFFGYAGNTTNGSVIKNLTLSGTYTSSVIENQGAFVNQVSSGYKLDVERCENYVNITNSNNSGSSGQNYGRGGIIGLCAGELTISYCENHGNIKCLSTSTSSRPYSNFGGILGLVNSTGTCRFKYDKNYGDVSVNNNDSAEAYRANMCGGILGAAKSSQLVEIGNCENYGTVYFSSNSNNYGSGGILGVSSSAILSVTECINNGTIQTGPKSGTNSVVGGIVGYATSGEVQVNNCINNGVITTGATSNSGYFGGIIAKSQTCNLKVYGCTNNGNITNTQNQDTFIGGILGGQVSMSTGSSTSYVTKCKNTGTITGNSSTADSPANCYIGGIMGQMQNNSSNPMKVINSVNYGSIINGKYIGGIVGYDIYGVSFVGNCANLGNVTGNSTLIGDVGGIVGHSSANNLYIKNCYCVYTGTSTGANVGYVAGYLNGSSQANSGPCYTKSDTTITPPSQAIGRLGSGGGSLTVRTFTGYGNMGDQDYDLLTQLNSNAASFGSDYDEWYQVATYDDYPYLGAWV